MNLWINEANDCWCWMKTKGIGEARWPSATRNQFQSSLPNGKIELISFAAALAPQAAYEEWVLIGLFFSLWVKGGSCRTAPQRKREQQHQSTWNSSIKRGGKWENWAAFLLFWLWVMSAERHRQQAKREDQPQLISSAEPEGNKPITKRKQRESTALFGLSFGWLWPLALLQRTHP